jgi:cell division protease FtsH
LALVGYTVWSFLGTRTPKPPSISYSELYGFVEQGKVATVSLSGQEVTGKLKQEETSGGKKVVEFRTVLPQQDDRDLLPLLRAQHVNVEVNSEHTSLLEQAAISFLPWVLILGGWFWISRRMQRVGGAGLPFGGIGARTRRVERQDGARVRFDDVAGLNSAKGDLREVVDFLREPSFWSGLPGPGRRFWHARSPERPTCPSSM